MALIKCVECGKEVSDKVKACLNCGDDIPAQIRKAKEKPWREMSKKEKRKTIILATIAAVIFSPIMLSMLKACVGTEEPLSPGEEKKFRAQQECKAYLRRQLAIPDSMHRVEYSNVMDIEPGKYELNISFKAKNYFGQEIPFSYHCVVTEKGENLYVKKVVENQY